MRFMARWLASPLDRATARRYDGGEGAAMAELEAVGDAVTGGVLGARGRARRGRGATAIRTRELASTAARSWPANIAMPAARRRTSTARSTRFFHDLLHGVLHFEGKIWRTLPMLAWRPGELTRRYIDGERAKFVSPIALFLFSVFLMFAVVKLDRQPCADCRPRRRARSCAGESRAEERRDSPSSRRERRRRRRGEAARPRSSTRRSAEAAGRARRA